MEKMDSDLIDLKDLSESVGGVEKEQDAGQSGPELLNMTEKTVYLMKKMAEYYYLTLEEIGLIYANQTYAYRVVNNLKRRGLLDEFQTTLHPRKALYLKAAGYRLLEKYGKLRLSRRFHPEEYRPFIFKHRMACAKAGLILQAHPLISDFLPESLLWERRKNSDPRLCDGEFLFQALSWQKALRVGLEVELTLKNRDKLVDSFRDLRAREDLDQVWWICGDQSLAGSISRAISGLPWLAPQQHFLCTMEDILAKKHRLSLLDCAGSAYTIDPAGATLPLPPEPEPVPIESQKVEEQAQVEAPRLPQPAPPNYFDVGGKPDVEIDNGRHVPGLDWLSRRIWPKRYDGYYGDSEPREIPWYLLFLVAAMIAGIWEFHVLNHSEEPTIAHPRARRASPNGCRSGKSRGGVANGLIWICI